MSKKSSPIKSSKKKEKDKSILESLKNKNYKKEFLRGLNKLGFPLEFKIRKQLLENGFNNIKEGFFPVNEDGEEIWKSFDFQGEIAKKKDILNKTTIQVDTLLIGECKSSAVKDKFLFAVPEMSNPGNKSFTGPILSSLSVANPKSYQNTMVISNFIESYGAIYIASDIKDTCGEHIISGVGDKDKNIKDYEKIYNICENTILPAVKARYKYWATCNLNDYEFMNLEDNQELVKEGLSRDWINFLKGYFFPIKLIIPVIITSKTILIPKLKNGEVIDVKKKNFLFYLHSAQKPKNHQPLITTTADIGVFICHEKSLNSFVDYIKRMQNMILEKVSESLSKRPRGFWEDYRQLKRFKKYL